MAELLVDVTHRDSPVARRSRAHLTTARTRAAPTPHLRASGATNIPTSRGLGSFGSSGSRVRPVAIPIHCPPCSATKVTRSAPIAPPLARSCHTRSGTFSSCASVEPNAVGASASTQSNGSQFQSFICANLPNLGSHFSALFNASHAARCVARHGVRSHPVPVALVGECSIPVV